MKQTATQQLGSAEVSSVTTSLEIGARHDYPKFYGGLLDELAVWNGTLPPELVQRIYTLQSACPD